MSIEPPSLLRKKKTKFKKRFLLFYILRLTNYLLMQLKTLLDKYIGRQKLTKQKSSWAYLSSPLKQVRTNIQKYFLG